MLENGLSKEPKKRNSISEYKIGTSNKAGILGIMLTKVTEQIPKLWNHLTSKTTFES